MTITQATRDLIGHGILAPIWRLDINGQDVTGTMFTGAGPALAVSMDTATAPAHRITITETRRPTAGDGFDFTSAIAAALEDDPDPDAHRITLHTGYLDPVRGEQLESMGDYWLEDMETTATETVYTLASAEVHIIGRKNYGGFSTANPGLLYTYAGNALANSGTAIRNFISAVLSNVAPAGDPWTLDVVDAPAVTADTHEHFNTEWGIEVWESLVHICTYAARRLLPAEEGVWRLVAVNRAAGPIRATLDTRPGGNVTDYRETWRPRDQVDAVGIGWTQTNSATGGEQFARITWPRGFETGYDLPRARTESLPRESTTAMAADHGETLYGALSPAPRAITLDGPAMPWLRPEDTVEVIRGETATTYLVSTITFDPTAGTMSLTTRSPQ